MFLRLGLEAFSCSKCPSEYSSGDGQDEVHIGDGISEGTQVDLVPDYIKNEKEIATKTTVSWLLAIKYAQGIVQVLHLHIMGIAGSPGPQ